MSNKRYYSINLLCPHNSMSDLRLGIMRFNILCYKLPRTKIVPVSWKFAAGARSYWESGDHRFQCILIHEISAGPRSYTPCYVLFTLQVIPSMFSWCKLFQGTFQDAHGQHLESLGEPERFILFMSITLPAFFWSFPLTKLIKDCWSRPMYPKRVYIIWRLAKLN